jgi:hypothetical protein
MVTWKLWQALQRPPLRSPLFRRAYRQQIPRSLPPIRLPLMGCARTLALIAAPIVLILFAAPMLVLVYYLALIIAPLLLPTANTVYGVLHTSAACGHIGKEREQQTYDILCTSPGGTLGMHWSYCAGWLHYHAAYRYALLGVLSIGLVSCLFGLGPQMIFGSYAAPLPVSLFRSLTLVVFFVIDYVETIVISSLTTLLIPIHSANENEARAKATGLFLVLQMAVYLTTFLFGVFALRGAFLLMGVERSVSDWLIPLLTLAFFVLVRELIITALWRMVEQELNADTVELDGIARLTV